MTTVARGGKTHAWYLGSKHALLIPESLGALTSEDGIVMSDGSPSYRAATRKVNRPHKVLNLSQGKRVCGPWHLNAVNQRHKTMKSSFNHCHRGVAIHYLDIYISWFERLEFRVDKSIQPDVVRVQLLEYPQLDT